QQAPWVQTLTSVVAAISAIPTALVGAWSKYGTKLRPLLNAIEDLKRKRAVLDARVADARRVRDAQAAALDEEAERQKAAAEKHRQRAHEQFLRAETERRAAAARTADAVAMNARAEQARRDLRKLEGDADALRPERRIASFILDRAS